MILSSDMLGLLAPAFAAGLAVAFTHVPLGQEVLRRGIIFIDLAIAQIAALGSVFAHVLFQMEGEGSAALSLVFALAFALTAGGVFAWLEKSAPAHQEALIGTAFVVSACLAILLLAGDPHGGEHLQGLLSGQILWVGWTQVGWTALAYIVLMGLWFGKARDRPALFFFVFPLAVTLSVQLVGVYLVFATLIVPALASASVSPPRRLIAGYVVAFVALVAGLLVSTAWDLPAGPTLVCSYALTAFWVKLLLR